MLPNAPDLISAGFPSLAHVPYLIGEDAFYPAEANRYLRARAMCEWGLRIGTGGPAIESRKKFLTPPTCMAIARRLAAFLNWCQSTGRDWKTIDYSTDVMQWQIGLQLGNSSASGKALIPATVNALISECCFFLTWASEIPSASGSKIRSPILIPVYSDRSARTNRGRSKGSRASVDSIVRVGSIRQRPSELLIPSPKEVGPWIHAMRIRYPVKSLMAELIIETGMRISEVNQLHLNDLPSRDRWPKILRAGFLPMKIRYGIKGSKISPNSMESVNPREVLVPIELADRIDHYRSTTRPMQLARWVRSAATKSERSQRERKEKPTRLWLSEYSQQPFANQQFYAAWTNTAGCPDGWHPHVGREYFAVETIVKYVREHYQAYSYKGTPELSWLQGAMRDQVRLLLSPLLGHIDDDTTMIYLRAVHLRLLEEFGHPALRWQSFCDDGELPPFDE